MTEMKHGAGSGGEMRAGDGLRRAKLHILQHSLGVDEYGRGDQYRNHFITGLGSLDYDNCLALVSDGLMSRRSGSPLTGGDDLFTVTPEGKRFVQDHSPSPPKLTRSQQRYQAYLEADCGLSFGEWLRARATAEPSQEGGR